MRDLNMEIAKSEKEQKAENLRKNSNVEDMLHHGYGNGLEMNYLFIGLARAAGFEASDVRVAPRNVIIFSTRNCRTRANSARTLSGFAPERRNTTSILPPSIFPSASFPGMKPIRKACVWARKRTTS